MRAILAGGGTGGHVIPALAIANELRSNFGADIIFIGTARGMEMRLVPRAGYELKLVEVGALNQVSTATRSEERRVGKECRSRWARNHTKKDKKIARYEPKQERQDED